MLLCNQCLILTDLQWQKMGKLYKIIPIQEVRTLPGGEIYTSDKVVKSGKKYHNTDSAIKNILLRRT